LKGEYSTENPQKEIEKSSMEAELVGASDYILWKTFIKRLVKYQGKCHR